jgi:hypothetical protein
MIWHLRDDHSAARTKVGRRKLRLFVAACFRRIWEVLPEPARGIVDLLEQAADGQTRPGADAHQEAQRFWQDSFRQPHHLRYLAYAFLRATSADSPGAQAVQVSNCLCTTLTVHPEHLAAHDAIQRRHADLLREIFGNPYRPLPRRKFPAELRGLAQACYDDPANYPVLADALADFGEEHAAAHCRLPEHVKGCHVVDWILGRG